MPELVLVTTSQPTDVYHEFADSGSGPLCRPVEANKQAVPLAFAFDAGLELCSLCEYQRLSESDDE